MATIRVDFDAYQIFYFSAFSYEASIECFSEGRLVGRMLFFAYGADVSSNRSYASGPSLHFKLRRFGDVINTLRHEKPLYLSFNTETRSGMLASSELEPTGDDDDE